MRFVHLATILLLFWLGSFGRAFAATQPLRHSDAQSPGQFVQVNGTKLYFEDCNSAAAISVVLLHDGLIHSVTWDEVWAPLCAKFHVLRYDRRGYGRSDAATAPFSPEEDLATLIRHSTTRHVATNPDLWSSLTVGTNPRRGSEAEWLSSSSHSQGTSPQVLNHCSIGLIRGSGGAGSTSRGDRSRCFRHGRSSSIKPARSRPSASAPNRSSLLQPFSRREWSPAGLPRVW